MDRERVIHTAEEMLELGKVLGASLPPNSILALSGNLGAGKTTFVQGLALGLQISDPVSSPTFVYLNTYSGSRLLFHFDLYRLRGAEDFLGLGFEEYFEKGGICAIEWPERIVNLLPPDTFHISFSYTSQGRIAVISPNLVNFIPK